MEVKIAVVKEWVNGFVPMSLMEERFKEAVKEALKHVTQDFKVGPALLMKLDSTKTLVENWKEHEAATGRRFMSVYEQQLMLAQMAAEGHDIFRN